MFDKYAPDDQARGLTKKTMVNNSTAAIRTEKRKSQPVSPNPYTAKLQRHHHDIKNSRFCTR